MATGPSTRNAPPLPQRTGVLVGLGLLAFHLSQFWADREEGLWLPGLGIGLALTAWLGQRVVFLLALDTIVVRLLTHSDQPIPQACLDSLFVPAQIALSWWTFERLAEGNRRLQDPRSATVFLLLIPGLIAGLFALVQAACWNLGGISESPFPTLAGALWISRILGILTWTPFLLTGVTPLLVSLRMIRPDPSSPLAGGTQPEDWTWDEGIETAGLCIGSAILALVLVFLHAESGTPSWALWGLSLLLVVWASLRQGLRGGALVSLVGGVAGLGLATSRGLSPSDFSPLQGNILAQCSTALLVGASAGWIRASEARYRQVVGQIPVVLYSVRLPRGFSISANRDGQPRPPRPDGSPGHSIVRQAQVTLVSKAALQIFRSEPDLLMGPYAAWLERIVPEDRELLLAALAQLCLQKQPVTCEYRLALPPNESAEVSTLGLPEGKPESLCWVRDTLAPHHLSDGALDGWEGVIEDISEQRALSHNLRRTTGMFQALITHLPTGIFFVQGPIGQPLLVNARARQLLGQREDHAAGIAHLSKVYRLHRPDGSEYPVEDLPVTRALRQGVTTMADDVVVHRPDGRRIPLITWAAPVNLAGGPSPDAAVWVLEDLSPLRQAEMARKESEARLRAVFETMGEGVVVQNQHGEVIECNPAACAILGKSMDELLGHAFPGPGITCLREDGTPLPSEARPDRCALETGQPVRDVLLGISSEGEATQNVRWIYVSAVPLPLGNAFTPNTRGARVVTTFTDITALRNVWLKGFAG